MRVCSDQFFMHVEITPRILLSQMSPKRPDTFLPIGPTHFWIHRDPKWKPRVIPRAHQSRATYPNPQLNWTLKVFWRLQSMVQRLPPKLLHPPNKDHLKYATPALVTAGWNDSRDSLIWSSCQSSPRSKQQRPYFNAAIMDSSEYLCMTIHIIKWRSSCGYEKNVTCKSCYYGDLMYPHPQRQPRQV